MSNSNGSALSNGGNGGQAGPYPGIVEATPPTDDPAFRTVGDPLRDRGALRQRAVVVTRELPNISVQTGWEVKDVRDALIDLSMGLFDAPSQLLDAIASDSRVQSAMRSRSSGLIGRPLQFKIPEKYKDDPDAKKCLRAWERHWPQMAAEPAMLDLLETSHCLGFSYAQILWDTNREIWKPYLQSFNSRFCYYHWDYRVHVAVTRDGSRPITPGDGHWILHAPYGSYRGWMRGALRALAQWWLARNYALRDWARYSERHGFPILLFKTPFGADPNEIANGQSSLQGIGQESILQLPGSVDVNRFGQYDLSYLEAGDENWPGFKALIDQCNDEITLALLGQNLTSQVKEGSYAAARVHADVRQAILDADARSLSRTLYVQVARPFAALNFGNPNFAPRVIWDVRPEEDLKVKAAAWQSFAAGLQALRNAGFALKNPERFARAFGIRNMDLKTVPPVQIEAQLARATGKDEGDSPGAEKKVLDHGDDQEDEQSDDGEDKPKASFASFAQRHAAFLADLKDMRELNLEPNIELLAELHDVPVPEHG